MIAKVLVVVALICFVGAVLGVADRLTLVAMGLAFEAGAKLVV